MKTKLTVTIDEDLLPRAKEYARSRGVSLSRLIQEVLRDLSAEGAAPFSRRWRGRFRPAERGDERYARLARRYL